MNVTIKYSQVDQERLDYWKNMLFSYSSTLRAMYHKGGFKGAKLDIMVRDDKGYAAILAALTKVQQVVVPIGAVINQDSE